MTDAMIWGILGVLGTAIAGPLRPNSIIFSECRLKSFKGLAVVGQVTLGMLAGPIARVIEHRPRRGLPAKRLVVAHIDPDPAGVGLAFGQDRDHGVVPVQSLGSQHIGLEAFARRLTPPPSAAAFLPDYIDRQVFRHAQRVLVAKA
jgi:hypothetical protein